MSERNGDRSRFGRLRKQKILRRSKNVKLREELAAKAAATPAVAPAAVSA